MSPSLRPPAPHPGGFSRSGLRVPPDPPGVGEIRSRRVDPVRYGAREQKRDDSGRTVTLRWV